MSLPRAPGTAALMLLALLVLPSLGQAAGGPVEDSVSTASESPGAPGGLPQPDALPGVNASDQSQPDIAIDGSRVHLVWVSVDGGRSRVFHSASTDLGNWTVPRVLGPASADANATGPHVSSGAGKVYVVWRESNASATVVRFATSLDSGGNFTRSGAVSPSPLPAATPVSISTASVGDDLHVAWSYPSADGGDLVIRSSTNATAGFWPAWTVPGAGPQTSPAVAASGATVLIAWEDGRNGEADVFSSVSTNRGSTFSAPAPAFVGQNGAAQRRPAATVDLAGRWWLGWEDEIGSDSFANVSWAIDAIAFPRGVRATTGNVTSGSLAFASGSSHLGLIDGLSSRAKAARRLDDSYSAPARTGNASVAERGLRGASYHGSLTVFVWTDSGPGNEELRLATLSWRGPSVTITSPPPGSLIGTAGAVVAWNSTDSNGSTTAATNLSWSQDLVSWTVSASGLEPNDSYLWKPPASVKGSVFIRVTSADTLSNRDGSMVEVLSDPVAPTAIAFDPAPGATGVPIGSSVSVTFSEPMDKASVESAFRLFERSSQLNLDWTWSGDRVSFYPLPSGLLEGRRYDALLGGGADLAGNSIPMSIPYDFTTTDSVAPVIDILSPTAKDMWNLSTRQIRWKTNDSGVIAKGGVDLRYSVEGGPNLTTLALGLNDTGSYNWSLPAGIDSTRAVVNFTVRDLVGNTGRNNSPPFEIDSKVPVIESSTPSNSETRVRPDVVARVNLSEPVDKLAVNSTAIFQSSKGNVTGTVNWTGEKSFSFAPHKNLSLATRYFLNFSTKDFAGNRLPGSIWFRTEDNRPPEITIQKPDAETVMNGEDPLDIKYLISDETGVLDNSITISRSYTSPPDWKTIVSGWNNSLTYTWLPNESVEAPVSYIKVEARDPDGNPGEKVSPAFRVDTIRPTVVRSSPENGSQNVPLNGTFIFEFSEPMANSPPAVTFSAPAGQILTNWTSRSILQVSHSVPFEVGEALAVIVSDAKDEAGNPMSSSYRLEGNTTIFPSKAHADGIVVSSEGAVLENVIVKAKNATTDLPELTTTTLKDGSFLLENLPPGPYVITFSLAGYRTTTIQRSLPAGLLTHLQDIVLFPADSTLPAYLPLFVLLLAVIGLIVLFILISRRMSVASEGEELKAYLRTSADGEVEKPSENGDGDDEPSGAEGPPDDPATEKKKEEATASED